MKKHILKFIGNDSGFGKNNNSAYFEDENNFVLIDCGFAVFNYLKSYFDFNKYSSIKIIITHLHNDHAGSLSQFILYIWFVYKKKVTVISKCKNIKKYLKITGTPQYTYIVKRKLQDLKFIKTKHVKELDCYGFNLNINGKKIVYTSDTITVDPFNRFLINCDELYIDVSKNGGVHLKFEETFETLRKIKNNKTEIYLMHLDDKEYIKKINNNQFNIDYLED